MNILYVMRYWPVYGGGETITVTLANELVRRGHTVHVAYEIENRIDPMPYSVDGRVREFRTVTTEKHSGADILRLRTYLRDNRIDAMINQWGDVTLCNRAREGIGCRLMTCWHLSIFRPLVPDGSLKSKIKKLLGGLYTDYYRFRQKRAHMRNYRQSDRYVFLSPSFAEEFCRSCLGRSSDAKVSAIPNPLTYADFLDPAKLPEKRREVLFVGRFLDYHKRIRLLLDIWKKVRTDGAFGDWKLVLVGDGPDRDMILRYVADNAIDGLSLEGFRNPVEYYRRASVFLMTSEFEGFGMTLLEAQQHGVVPVAMDSYSSLHDIVEDGRNGLIVPNNDVDGYVARLKRLMSEASYRNGLAVNALEDCRKFSVGPIVDRWERLMSEGVVQ